VRSILAAGKIIDTLLRADLVIVDLSRPRDYAEPAAPWAGNLGSGVLIGSSNCDWSA
jgi:hypothetical protein